MSKNFFLAFFVSILPVAYIYAFPVLINNLGHALMLFVIFPILLFDYSKSSRRGDSATYKYYVLFCLYLILISIISPLLYNFTGDVRELFSAAEFSLIVYFLIANKSLSKEFVEIYSKMATMFSGFLILQFFAFSFLRVKISGIIPFLNVYNRDIESIIESRIIRISSVFAEPSHFAVYCIPALIMYLFNKTQQDGVVIRIVVISLAILLSTSSNGLLVMGVVYFAYLVYKYFSRFNVGYFIVGGILFIFAAYFVLNSDYIDEVTYGLFTQEVGQSESKAEMRIYRGFNLYADMPLGTKIFGVGWRDAENYCKGCNTFLYTYYNATVFDYFNSIAGTLIYAGVTGLTFLLLFFYSLWRRTKDFATRTLVLCVILLMSSSSVLMSDQWVFFLATIISMININNEKNNNYLIAKRHSYGQ